MKIAWEHFQRYKPLLKELVSRDLKVKYRRSFLGYVWSLLNPLLMMTVIAIVFSYLFKSDIPNFPLYLICGQTLFNFFNESTTMSMYSIIQSSALIKKVYIPKFIFPVSRVLSCFVTMSFSLLAIIVVMITTHTPFFRTMLLFPIPLFFLFVFCVGIGMALSVLSVYFRDITHLYGVLTMAWMYLTPVFYPVTILPPDLLKIVKLNPLYSYIQFFRAVVMYGEIPPISIWVFCAASSLLSVMVGVTVFSKMQKNIILYV